MKNGLAQTLLTLTRRLTHAARRHDPVDDLRAVLRRQQEHDRGR